MTALRLPDLTLQTLQGEPFRLRAEPPAPRLFLVYRHDCEACSLILPVVERISRPLHARGLETVGVSQSDEESTLDAINEHGLCFPQTLDAELALSQTLGIAVVPSLFLFAADGELIDRTEAEETSGWTRIMAAAATLAGADEAALLRTIASFGLPPSIPGSPSRKLGES